MWKHHRLNNTPASRLMNKYTSLGEITFQEYLNYALQSWGTPRTLLEYSDSVIN